MFTDVTRPLRSRFDVPVRCDVGSPVDVLYPRLSVITFVYFENLRGADADRRNVRLSSPGSEEASAC